MKTTLKLPHRGDYSVGTARKATDNQQSSTATGESNSRLYPSRFSSRYYHLTSLRKCNELIARKYLANGDNLVLVDFGCGDVPYRPLFEDYVAQYISVDLPGNKKADFYISPEDGTTQLPDGLADVVLSTQVLEHVDNPARYLLECRRLLKHGALLILSTHGYWMYHPDPTDYWRWTGSGLHKLLEAVGFDIVQVEGIMGLTSTSLHLFQDALLPKLPRPTRPPFTLVMQVLIALADRLDSSSEKKKDASVFLVVASKGRTGDNAKPANITPISQSRLTKTHAACGQPDQPLPVVCVVFPNGSTFIDSHIRRLPARIKMLYGGLIPRYTDGAKPVLPSHPALKLAYAASSHLLRLPPKYFHTRALIRFLKANKVNVALAEYGPTGAAISDACGEAGVPLVVHFHGFDASDHATLEQCGGSYKRMFAMAHALVAVSRDMEQRLLALGAPREKLFYNPYGVDTSLFSGADPATAPPLFIAVGRFVDKKAPHLTILAFKKVSAASPDARLVMIGDGELREACSLLALGLGITHVVQFLGSRPHAEVAAAMRRARVFVQHSILPSHGDAEGLPVAVLEAGATGLPVIATRHGGILDAVVDRETGLLVDEGDVDGMADSMIRLAKDPVLASRLGRAARERMCAAFSMEKSISGLWSIIQAAIQ